MKENLASTHNLKTFTPPATSGLEIYKFIEELYPICRSITGDGLRETLRMIQRHIPLKIHEVPSGTQVFDWTVPKEWNINDAYVKDSKGNKVIDFQQSNLHVLNYSIPVNKIVSLKELREHLFTLPDYPDWIPYRTSYYKENWGFCLSHNQLKGLEDGEYEVFIDSTLKDGFLSYGELYLRGEDDDEILISCHACHPSLANDNLSGVSLSTMLARHLGTISHRFSYRFIFIPGTIGAITWLCLNEAKTSKVRHGLVVACVGDSGKFHYKKSRRGNAEIDRIAANVLKHSGCDYEIMEFSPYGYDERQYCSPGFDLPVGSLTRTPYGCYCEYHTSADNLDIVNPGYLSESFDNYLQILYVIENNRRYENLIPRCEPQLGKRGLFGLTGGKVDRVKNEIAMLWVLNLSDVSSTLLDISERSNLDFSTIKKVADILCEKGLLRPLKS
jgi:aminopeptidase-like protein